MNARDKLAALRREMKTLGINALYVPSADPHQSEYLPDAWKHRAWLSGFTGSMGELVVGPRRAAMWTDGRYFLQASKELEGSGIELMRMGEPGTPAMTTWAAKQLRPGQSLGVDATVVSMSAADEFEMTLAPLGVGVEFLRANPIDAIWADRPEDSLAPVTVHPRRYAGETPQSKLARLREAMKMHGAKAHVVCSLDQVAWLLNIRADDIAFTPVVTAYVIVTDRGCTLYVDERKLTREMIRELRPFTKVADYKKVWADLAALGRQKVTVWVDPTSTSRRVADTLKKAPLIRAASPLVAMRAVKNPTQIKAITEAHRRDGADHAAPGPGQALQEHARCGRDLLGVMAGENLLLRAYPELADRHRDGASVNHCQARVGPRRALAQQEIAPEGEQLRSRAPRSLHLETGRAVVRGVRDPRINEELVPCHPEPMPDPRGADGVAKLAGPIPGPPALDAVGVVDRDEIPQLSALRWSPRR